MPYRLELPRIVHQPGGGDLIVRTEEECETALALGYTLRPSPALPVPAVPVAAPKGRAK